jgi:DNA gyrase/topoisomerase IV subunit B
VEHIADRLANRGVTLEDLIRARNPQGQLPLYRVTVKNGGRGALWAYSEADLRRSARGDGGASGPSPGRGGRRRGRGPSPGRKFIPATSWPSSLSSLDKKGFGAETLLTQEQPIIFVTDGEKKKTPVFSLMELLNAVREHGRKGLGIQRYKGLGEMNPEQLWETTLNPQNRKLLRVHLESAAKAEEIFSTLMGDEVEPRRQFIEDNALNVRNLDMMRRVR